MRFPAVSSDMANTLGGPRSRGPGSGGGAHMPKATKLLGVEPQDLLGVKPRHATAQSPSRAGPDDVAWPSMVDAALRNAEAPWDNFSSQDYWRHNYLTVQPEDREIIDRVSNFFICALADRGRVRRAIDVGSGANLYPALLMLPWTDQILLSDLSASNVNWLRRRVQDEDSSWDWQPFWVEMGKRPCYRQIGDPRKQLRGACLSEPGLAGIEQRSVFDLPRAQWQLGTMFFVAESITRDRAEFYRALSRFTGALTPGAPFAATFMAGSTGYPVAEIRFPALPITANDVVDHFAKLGVSDLSVHENQAETRVRPGYEGMIVATGFAGVG
jgi:hypothetical protein